MNGSVTVLLFRYQYVLSSLYTGWKGEDKYLCSLLDKMTEVAMHEIKHSPWLPYEVAKMICKELGAEFAEAEWPRALKET